MYTTTNCGLFTMFHELGQIEDALRNLWNGLQCQSLLQVGHQILLVDRSVHMQGERQ